MTDTYTPLATVTLGGTASSVTFSSIPATYRDLVLVVAGTASTLVNVGIRFNGDTGSNYSVVTMVGNGSAASSSSFTDSFGLAGQLSTVQGNFITQIMDYSATDKHKTHLGRSNLSASSVQGYASRWADTAAITSFAVSNAGTFSTGTTFNLYGIAS
jgi:hypothetical protein